MSHWIGRALVFPTPNPILPKLMGSIAGPREPQVESLWRAVACWGQGIGPGRGSRHEQTHCCDMETRLPWDFWKVSVGGPGGDVKQGLI